MVHILEGNNGEPACRCVEEAEQIYLRAFAFDVLLLYTFIRGRVEKPYEYDRCLETC